MQGLGLRFYAIAFMLYLLVPIGIVVLYSFDTGDRFLWPPEGLTLDWYREALQSRLIRGSMRSSVYVALGTTALSTVVAIPMAYALARWKFPGHGMINALILLAILTYGIVTAVALLLWFRTLGVAGGLIPTVLGHSVFIFPFGVVIIRDRLAQPDLSIEEASLDLGASEWQTFRRITLPMILPSIVAAMLFMFTLSIGEYLLSAFLTGNQTTFPVYLASQMRYGLSPILNAAATVLIALPVVFTLVGLLRFGGAMEEAVT